MYSVRRGLFFYVFFFSDDPKNVQSGSNLGFVVSFSIALEYRWVGDVYYILIINVISP